MLIEMLRVQQTGYILAGDYPGCTEVPGDFFKGLVAHLPHHILHFIHESASF